MLWALLLPYASALESRHRDPPHEPAQLAASALLLLLLALLLAMTRGANQIQHLVVRHLKEDHAFALGQHHLGQQSAEHVRMATLCSHRLPCWGAISVPRGTSP